MYRIFLFIGVLFLCSCTKEEVREEQSTLSIEQRSNSTPNEIQESQSFKGLFATFNENLLTPTFSNKEVNSDFKFLFK